MFKTKAGRVEGDPVRKMLDRSVALITHDRQAAHRGLRSELVLSTGEKLQFKKCKSSARTSKATTGPAELPFAVACEPSLLLLRDAGTRERILPENDFIRGRNLNSRSRPLDDGEIDLQHLSTAKLVRKPRGCFACLGKNDKSADRSVDSVDESHECFSEFAFAFFAVGLSKIKEVWLAGRVPLDQQTGGFFNNEEMIVLEDNS